MNRRKWIMALFGGVAALLLLGGGAAVWAVVQLADQIGAPGPSATGSGPCGSGDSVNVRLVFADGRVTQACTRDRPQCGNTNMGPTGGQVFALSNQLRSDASRYIFTVRFDVAVANDVSEQVAQVDAGMVLPKDGGPSSSDPLAPHALVA